MRFIVSCWSQSSVTGRNVCHARISRTVYPLILACLLAMPVPASSAERAVLVLVAEDYNRLKRSEIGVKQSREIAEALRAHGFDVLMTPNPTNAAARATLREFSQKIKGAEIAIAVLVGHIAATRGHSFFLPVNANIRRGTDLLTRGIAVSSVAQITARAETGAVLFLTTVADISSTLRGVAARPSMAVKPAENVVVVFSSSGKVPVSGVGAVTKQAALDLIDAARTTPLKLRALVDAVAARGAGLVIGTVPDLNLSTLPSEEAEISEAEIAKQNAELQARLKADREARRKAELKARRQAELKVRRRAELRVREAEERALRAEERAKRAEERARREAARRALEASTRTALGAADAAGNAPTDAADMVDEPSQALGSDIASLQLVETLLGRTQRKEIQKRLQRLGLYHGRIDAIFGPLTRQAIKDFQTAHRAEPTGYLTPQQFQLLVGREVSQPLRGRQLRSDPKKKVSSRPKIQKPTVVISLVTLQWTQV